MNISVKSEYALQAIFDLASQRPGEPVKIADIARRQKIPQKFLELILAGLKQGGFVESRRGAEGGYLLAREPEWLTVGELLRFVEGAATPKGAGGGPRHLRHNRPHHVCRPAPRLDRETEQVRLELGDLTLPVFEDNS